MCSVCHNLLCVSKPWDRQTWNGIRVAADNDQVLVQGKVRDDTVADQFDKLNQKQQEDMKKYKSTLMEPAKTKLLFVFLYNIILYL